MGLMDDIRAHDVSGNRARCSVEAMVAGVTGDDRADLMDALADHTVPATAIARAMQARGFDVKGGAVARHRRGACACPR